jgi:hypothetical protein
VLATLRSEARRGDLTIRVTGDCMAPLLGSGAEVRIGARPFYWPGDVVAFASRAGELVIHRLVGYRLRRGGLWAITMPDQVSQPDASVPLARIVGRIRGGECDRRAVTIPLIDRLRALRRFVVAALERLGR